MVLQLLLVLLSSDVSGDTLTFYHPSSLSSFDEDTSRADDSLYDVKADPRKTLMSDIIFVFYPKGTAAYRSAKLARHFSVPCPDVEVLRTNSAGFQRPRSASSSSGYSAKLLVPSWISIITLEAL